jgi:hypothetical protein
MSCIIAGHFFRSSGLKKGVHKSYSSAASIQPSIKGPKYNLIHNPYTSITLVGVVSQRKVRSPKGLKKVVILGEVYIDLVQSSHTRGGIHRSCTFIKENKDFYVVKNGKLRGFFFRWSMAIANKAKIGYLRKKHLWVCRLLLTCYENLK